MGKREAKRARKEVGCILDWLLVLFGMVDGYWSVP